MYFLQQLSHGLDLGLCLLLVIASLVVSHWVLDVITHRPDMPLYPGSPKFGLGLWNSIPLTMAVEVPLYAVGVWIYMRTTRARDGIGRWAFAAFVPFLVFVYIANIVGPPPPSVAAIYRACALPGGPICDA